MLPIKKSSIPYLRIALINIFLLAAGVVHAEVEQNRRSLSINSGQPEKVKSNQTKSRFISSDEFLTSNMIANMFAAESTEEGLPSLRRQPSGGDLFEPKRIPLQIPFPEEAYKTSPSITIVNPSAYGASWGNVGVGFGFQERVRFKDKSDGVMGIGFGLGDAKKNLGVQVGISLVDLSSPWSDGAVNIKLHRRLPKDFAIAAGVQGLTTWGNTDGGSSVYGVATKKFQLRPDRTKPFSELYTSLGIGGGQFRSESNINEGKENIGVFGSVAVKIIQPVGFVAEWSGQDLTLGVPIVPFRKLPLVVVPSITDVTGSAGDGTRFVLGVGYSFSFK